MQNKLPVVNVSPVWLRGAVGAPKLPAGELEHVLMAASESALFLGSHSAGILQAGCVR